jgi:hypothetical protein
MRADEDQPNANVENDLGGSTEDSVQGVVHEPPKPTDFGGSYDGLARIVAAWPRLSWGARGGISAIVEGLAGCRLAVIR